jgi:hypothetical protein
LVNDLQNNKSFEEKPDVKKSQHRNKNISNIEIKKKDKKYLEGIPLQPEAEINESEPTYYYYKVKTINYFSIILKILIEMGLVNFPMGLHKSKTIMQLFFKNKSK